MEGDSDREVKINHDKGDGEQCQSASACQVEIGGDPAGVPLFFEENPVDEPVAEPFHAYKQNDAPKIDAQKGKVRNSRK